VTLDGAKDKQGAYSAAPRVSVAARDAHRRTVASVVGGLTEV